MAVPWRKSEDDHKMDGERLKSDVVIMDRVHRKGGHGGTRPGPEASVHIACELGGVGLHGQMSGMYVVASENDDTNAHGKLSLAA